MKTEKTLKIADNIVLAVDFDKAADKKEAAYICLYYGEEFFSDDSCNTWGNPQKIVKALRSAADHLEKVSGAK